MKLPYLYKNVRLKDYKWIIHQYDKWAEKQLEQRELLENPWEEPDSYPNHYKKYYDVVVKHYKDIDNDSNNNIGDLGKFKRAKEEFKLNAQEYALIYGYTAWNISEDLNSVLANVKNPKKKYYHIWLNEILLNKALSKIPCFNGKNVYHFTKYKSEEEVAEHSQYLRENIGKRIRINHFLSTHYDDVRIEDSIYYLIQTKKKRSRARNISNISFVDNEKEVLFKSKVSFKVISYSEVEKLAILKE